MACMPVGRRAQTCLTSVLERVPHTANIAIWDMIAFIIILKLCGYYEGNFAKTVKQNTAIKEEDGKIGAHDNRI